MRSRSLLDATGLPGRAPASAERRPTGWLERVDRALAPAAVLLVLAALSAALWYLAQQPGAGADFARLRTAGARFLQGERLYRASDGASFYKYAPGAALLFAPLALLPLRLAWLAFDLLSILALVRAMRWSAAQLGLRPGLLEQLAVLLLAFPFALALLQAGSCDALLLWVMVESESQSERRPWLSGFLWATACAVKPSFLIFGLAALAFRQWGRIAWAGLGLVLWFGVGTARFGALLHLRQLHDWYDLLSAATPGLLCGSGNQSAFAVACSYLAHPAGGARFKVALAGLALVVMVSAVWSSGRVWQRRSPRAGRFTLVATLFYLSAFLSPLAGRATLVAAIPLLWILVSAARSSARPALRGLATAAALAMAAAGLATLFTGAPGGLAWLAQRGPGLAVLLGALAALICQGWPRSSPAASGGLPWRYSSARTSIRLS